jgi:hypothetical protein
MLTAAFGAGFMSLSAQAVTISLVANPSSVDSGGMFAVDIVAADLAGAEFVSAYEFSIEFDPLEFTFVANSFAVGTALGSVLDEDYFDFSDFSNADAGSLLPFVTSLLEDAALAALQPGGDVLLGSFDLRARRSATALEASIGLTCSSVAGPLDTAGIAVLLDVTACDGATISIAPVAAPESGTLALLSLGLLGLGLVTRPVRRSHHDC